MRGLCVIFFLNVLLIKQAQLRDLIPGEEDYDYPAEEALFDTRQSAASPCDKYATPAARHYKYSSYLTFLQIEERLKYLDCLYDSILLEVVGYSVENRPLYMVTISSTIKNGAMGHSFTPVEILLKRAASISGQTAGEGNPTTTISKSNNNEKETPVFFIDAGIHAREWAAPAAGLKIIEELAKKSKEAPFNSFNWQVMPMVNPDGYLYSWTNDRMWRKNRSTFKNSECSGVDLNRNTDVYWSRTNRNKCKIVYGGSSPFSEPETATLRKVLKRSRGNLMAYFTLHSYGQLILYPFGYNKTRNARNKVQLIQVGEAMAKAIKREVPLGSDYMVHQASFLGEAPGGTDDWAYLSAQAKFSYTFEMQPSLYRKKFLRRSGFDLPGYMLPKAVEEVWVAIKTMAQEIQSKIKNSN